MLSGGKGESFSEVIKRFEKKVIKEEKEKTSKEVEDDILKKIRGF